MSESNSQPVNSQPVNVEVASSQSVNVEVASGQPVNSQPVNSQVIIQQTIVVKQVQPVSLQYNADHVQQVVDAIHDLLKNRKITESLLIRVVANAMVVTAKMKLQNSVKKKVVIAALEKFIKEKAELSESEIDALMTVVDVVVSDAIDVISDVKKGSIQVSVGCCGW